MENYTLETALIEYGSVAPTEYALTLIDAQGAKHTHSLNPDNAKVFVAIDNAERVGKRLDLARCLMFAKIDRDINTKENNKPRLGVSTRDIIMQKWHYSKATANMYLNIGKSFYTNKGTEKVAGISAFSVAQVVPFLPIVSDYPVVGGLETDADTFEWLIANGYITAEMGTKELEGIAKVWKMGCFPKEWVKDGVLDWYIPSTLVGNEDYTGKVEWLEDLRFSECPKPIEPSAEASAEDKPEDKPDDKPEDKPEDTSQTSLYASIAHVLSAIDELPISEDLREKWANLKGDIFKLAIATDEYLKPEDKPEDKPAKASKKGNSRK